MHSGDIPTVIEFLDMLAIDLGPEEWVEVLTPEDWADLDKSLAGAN